MNINNGNFRHSVNSNYYYHILEMMKLRFRDSLQDKKGAGPERGSRGYLAKMLSPHGFTGPSRNQVLPSYPLDSDSHHRGFGSRECSVLIPQGMCSWQFRLTLWPIEILLCVLTEGSTQLWIID